MKKKTQYDSARDAEDSFSSMALVCFQLQVTHPKTDEQRQRLQEACRDILLFKNLDPVSPLIKKNWAVFSFVFFNCVSGSQDS